MMNLKTILLCVSLGCALALPSAAATAKSTTTAKPVTKTATKVNINSKDTLIKAVLTVFIKTYGNNPTEAEKAWWRKRIACGEIKTMKSLVSSIDFHHSKKVRMGGNTICGGPKITTSSSGGAPGVTRRQVAGISSSSMGDQVRIGIYYTTGKKTITVTANGPFQVREGQKKILSKRGGADEVSVSWSDGKYHVRGSGMNFDTKEEIRFVPVDSSIMKILSYSDPSKTYPGKNYNRFRGVIEVRKCDGCDQLWAINELQTEYYLRGLGETSGEGPVEYLKALSVAARTYVLYHKVITGGRNAQANFDITNTPDDQIYRGYEYEIITPRMSSEFAKTKGIIVADSEGDKPVASIYFSDSDGHTRSAQEVWHSSRFPYLQSVADPFHNSSICLGHCVGMSAQGAYGFASKENWSFQKILGYFFKGITLVKAY